MENKKLIILAVLAVFGIASLIYGITSPPRGKNGTLSAPKRGHEPLPDKERIVPTARNASRSAYDEWGRNPFTPAGYGKVERPELTISGVIWDEKTPKAIINNDIVGVGAIIGPYTVIEIRRDSVTLNDGTKDTTLDLGQ